MLEQRYVKEYLYDKDDEDSGFTLRNKCDEFTPETVCYRLYPISGSEWLEFVISHCQITLPPCRFEIEPLVVSAVRCILSSELSLWQIDSIKAFPGKVRLVMSALRPDILESLAAADICQKYLSDEVRNFLNHTDEEILLDFYPRFGSREIDLRFYKGTQATKMRRYSFGINTWNFEYTRLIVYSDSSSGQLEYKFLWKNKAKQSMIAEIYEYADF